MGTGSPWKRCFDLSLNASLGAGLNSYKKAIKEKQILNEIKEDLVSLGWKENEANLFVKNLQGSIDQAAYVMQPLRSKMGDVHGAKPTLKPLVFDAVKWATIIVRLLK